MAADNRYRGPGHGGNREGWINATSGLHRLTSIDDHGVLDDEGRRIGTQPEDGIGNLLWLPHPSDGLLCDHPVRPQKCPGEAIHRAPCAGDLQSTIDMRVGVLRPRNVIDPPTPRGPQRLYPVPCLLTLFFDVLPVAVVLDGNQQGGVV